MVFHILSPLPIIISRRFSGDGYMSDPYSGRCIELSAFLTTIFVISAYMLPIVMANTPIGAPLIKWSSAGFIFAGNSVIFLTIYIFVRLLLAEDNFSGW